MNTLKAINMINPHVEDFWKLWAKEEEAAATSDLKMLGEAMTALEAAVDVNIKDPE